MKKILLSLATIAVSLGTSYAQITNGSHWGDYTATVSGDKIVITDEYGSNTLTKQGNRYTGKDYSFDADYKSFIIDGKKQGVLLVYADNDERYTILENYTSIEQEQDAAINMLVGEYTDQNGTKYTFTRNQMITNGKSINYTIGNQIRRTNIIKVDGKEYLLIFSMEGVKMCDFKINDDYPELVSVYKNLKATNTKPRFEFTSSRLVSRAYFEIRTSKDLRLMRNEIYARHGYTFNSADLKQYFGSKPWYKALNNNSAVKLSEIETFNVEMLKLMEDMAKFEEKFR